MMTTMLSEREELIRAAIELEPISRAPIIYQGHAFSPRLMGVSLAEFADDPDVAAATTLAAVEELGGFDAVNVLPGGIVSVGMSSVWLTKVLVPGKDLPDDAVWQAAEAEVMTADDYPRLISEGWPALRQSLLPRVLDMSELQRSGDWAAESLDRVIGMFHERGYPVLTAAITCIPFEQLCGARSLPKFYMDLYRRPDLVREAMAAMLPGTIESAVAMAQASHLRGVWIGGWRTAGGMLTESMWLEYVLPQVRDLATALVESGFTPILHFDHDWTRDLRHLRELPPKSCILQLDSMTDIRRAKEILGDHMAIMGDVPAAILAQGSPDETRAYVRALLRDVGPRGFLLAAGCDIPVDAKAENVIAMMETGLEGTPND
jgi:uroporphyrinogen-III decarboxylase